jgi:hypothetical protein
MGLMCVASERSGTLECVFDTLATIAWEAGQAQGDSVGHLKKGSTLYLCADPSRKNGPPRSRNGVTISGNHGSRSSGRYNDSEYSALPLSIIAQ